MAKAAGTLLLPWLCLVAQAAPTGPDGRFVVTVGDDARYRLVGDLRPPAAS